MFCSKEHFSSIEFFLIFVPIYQFLYFLGQNIKLLPVMDEHSSENTCFPFFLRMFAAIRTFKASYTLLLMFCSSFDFFSKFLKMFTKIKISHFRCPRVLNPILALNSQPPPYTSPSPFDLQFL